MPWKTVAFLGLFTVLLWGLSPLQQSWIYAAEEKQKTVKTVKGIHFNLPEDWPLEEQGGGAVGPISVEEYLILKFDKTEERFKRIEADTSRDLQGLDSRLKLTEEQAADIDKRLKDMERWLKKGEARRLD